MIPATLLSERNAEDFTVEFATFGSLADNWTKTCDEQNLYVARNLHATSPSSFTVAAVLVIPSFSYTWIAPLRKADDSMLPIVLIDAQAYRFVKIRPWS